MAMHNTGTSDLREARRQRDAFVSETKAAFAAIRAGTYVAPDQRQASPSARGALWRDTLRELQVRELEASAVDGPDGDGPPSDEPWREPPSALDLAIDVMHDEREALRPAGRRAFDAARLGEVAFGHHAPAYVRSLRLATKTMTERAGLLALVSTWFTGRGLTLDAIGRREIGLYCTEVLEDLHRVTAVKRLGAARGYWAWLVTKGHVPNGDGDPWAGQLPKGGKRRVERADTEGNENERPFTEAEVIKLLCAPWPARQRKRHRSIIIDGLALALLSGLREAELVNLRVGDVVYPEGFPGGVMRVREGKGLAAIRRVPVHPAVVSIVERRQAGGRPNDMLFADLWADRVEGRGSAADTFGKMFKRYRMALGVNDPRPDKRRGLVNFHSTRRWFITEAVRARVPLETVAGVVGHKEGDMDGVFAQTLHYVGDLTDALRLACVEAVRLPDQAAKALLAAPPAPLP